MGIIKVPYVIEQTSHGQRQVDIYSRLLSDRLMFLTGEINDEVAEILIAQLFYLESEDPKKDINIYINSPGGIVTAGLAIYDAMQYISCDIATICLGQAASLAAVLVAAGTKGKRMALPNARVMIHQPLGGAQGQATDMEIQIREVNRIKRRLNEILSFHTEQPIGIIEKDTERDFFLTADDAVKYGMIDKVISNRPLNKR